MSGPYDPDATTPFGPRGGEPTEPFGGGDVTRPVGPRGGDATRPVPPVGPGGPAGGGPEEPGFYDEEGRPWWVYGIGALIAGVLVGALIALVLSGGDDKKPHATTTTSSSTSTSTSTTSTSTTLPPTTTTTAPSAPGQVTGLSAGPGGGSGEVSLTWNPVASATSYRIYRTATMGTNGSLIATVNKTSYTDVPGDGCWYYQVSAVDANGLEGERSHEAAGAPVGSSC
jgi:hypothetical protein